MFVNLLRTIRSSELLTAHGYSLRAYSIQRSIKDQIWILCAAVSNFASFDKLFGYEGLGREWNEADKIKHFKQRLATEKSVREQIVGANSNLTEKTRAQLLIWERMFNLEAHRAHYSYMRSCNRFYKDGEYFPALGPEIDYLADAMFMNRSMELNWLALRLLPFMRRPDGPHNTHWEDRWALLDRSFRFMFDGFNELGKAIAPAYLELIEAKFAFNTKTYYSEPTPATTP